MEPRNIILNELKGISKVLANSYPVSVPFTVPSGYFEQFPLQVIDILKVSEAPAFPGQSRELLFDVPQGYFENFADTMLAKVRALENEEETISPLLASLKNKNTFSVPEGYFEGLASNITDGAKALDIVNETLEQDESFLKGLKHLPTYQAPQGYFENFAENMLSKVQPEAKVIRMSFTRKVMRYAAAAVVAGLIITLGWNQWNKPVQGNTEVASTTVVPATISDNEIESFLALEHTSTASTNTVSETSEFSIEPENVKDLLADVSDEELQQYVEQNAATN